MIQQQISSKVSAEVADAIKEPVKEAFLNYFEELLVPSFESATNNMFAQISTSFQQVVREGNKIYYFHN